MHIKIEEFTQADYDNYLSDAIDEYAAVNIKNGRWTAEQARAMSQKQFDYLLKDGLKSEGHTFWNICLDDKKVGLFWFYRNPKQLNNIFVYDTQIVKEYQNQGVGTSTFPIIRERLKAMGVHKISLNVFANNTGAIRLYKRLGFEMTSYNMHYLIN